MPGNPVRMSEAAAPPERPPWLGEHTGDVLRAELGPGPAELRAQRDDGVIA